MDTSEEYVEMCRMSRNDVLMTIDNKLKKDMLFRFISDRNTIYSTHGILLYRQDQLQEMLKDKIKATHKDSFGYKLGSYPEGYICLCLMAEIEEFIVIEYQYIDYIGFDSMEQLWLIYVMDKVYGKRWNGIDWVV